MVGSGSVPLTNGSGSLRPKSLRLRIRNTASRCRNTAKRLWYRYLYNRRKEVPGSDQTEVLEPNDWTILELGLSLLPALFTIHRPVWQKIRPTYYFQTARSLFKSIQQTGNVLYALEFSVRYRKRFNYNEKRKNDVVNPNCNIKASKVLVKGTVQRDRSGRK